MICPMSKRPFRLTLVIMVTVLAVAMVLSGCSGKSTEPAKTPTPTPAAGDAKFDWQRYKGQTINVLLMKNPWSDLLEKKAPEFEKLTGIKVNIESIPEIQARQKMTVDMASGGTNIDVFYTTLMVEKKRYWKAGWYQDLRPMLQNKSLVMPDYDWADLMPAAVEGITEPDGTIVALPNMVDVWALFYRKDIFQEKGIAVPKTIEEMEKIAKQLHNPGQMSGFVARGLKNANAPGYAWLLYSYGGDAITKDGKADLTSQAAVDALDYYSRMLRLYGPPGVINFNWNEAAAVFSQGQAAMYFDGVNFASQFEDASKSKIAGKVGYAPLPAGPKGHYAPTFPNGLAISSKSKVKEASFLFTQWATAKEFSTYAQVNGVGTGRQSAWNDPAVKKATTMPQAWADAIQESMKIGRGALPFVVPVTEFRDIVGVAIQKAISGTDPKQALEQANKEFQDALDKNEK